MAHDLETWDGGVSASFVSARRHAWHRLGTVLAAEFTAADAMAHAKLGGWNVRTQALQTTPMLSNDGWMCWRCRSISRRSGRTR